MGFDSNANLHWRERHQQSLVDFLQVDLDLAFTMVRTARVTCGSAPQRAHETIEKTRRALQGIRCMEGRIENPAQWKIIHDRADELEHALEALD